MSIDASKIIFGGASLSSVGGGYGMGEIDNPRGLIEAALDQGIKLFDTAPIYGFNQSEQTLGQNLSSDIRESVKIISKAGVSWHDNKRVNLSNDPKVIQSMLEESLNNLDTDYIDIYMTHWPDAKVDIRRPLEVLKKAQDQGKIMSIGMCNTNSEDLLKAKEVCDIEYIQSECNLFQNKFESLAKDLKSSNIKTMGWGTFDKGILAGTVKTDRKFDKYDCRSWASWWKKSNWKEKVKLADKINRETNGELFNCALQYSLSHSHYSICGFKSVEQLMQTVECAKDEIDYSLIEKALHFARA